MSDHVTDGKLAAAFFAGVDDDVPLPNRVDLEGCILALGCPLVDIHVILFVLVALNLIQRGHLKHLAVGAPVAIVELLSLFS